MTNATKFRILCKSSEAGDWMFADDLTFNEAFEICETHNWLFNSEDEIWEMKIEDDVHDLQKQYENDLHEQWVDALTNGDELMMDEILRIKGLYEED